MNKFNRLLRQEQINYLNAMVRYLQSENLSVFAGAGVSIDSGFVDWKGLLKPIIEQLGVNPNIDLSLVAQFYKNEYGRHDINELIYNEFNKKHKSNEIIKKLGKLPIKSYWTTNYDSLIEDTLTSSPILKKVHVVREKTSSSIRLRILMLSCIKCTEIKQNRITLLLQKMITKPMIKKEMFFLKHYLQN